MSYRIEDFQNDPTWVSSLGEKLGKIHFRNGHFHAECDPKTGFCEIHYDQDNPNESLSSLFKHIWNSGLGRTVLVIGVSALADQFFTGGKIRKSLLELLK